MRGLIAGLIGAAAWAASAFANPQYPVVVGGQSAGINADGVVVMCPTEAAGYVPCGTPGAQPLPATVLNTPAVVPQQPRVITAIATGTTGAVTATLAAVPNKTAYICGFDVSGIGGTAQLGPITVTGLLGGTFTYQQIVSTTSGVYFGRTFTPCIPAKDSTTAIAVVTTADGTATAVDVQAWGVAQ